MGLWAFIGSEIQALGSEARTRRAAATALAAHSCAAAARSAESGRLGPLHDSRLHMKQAGSQLMSNETLHKDPLHSTHLHLML